MKNYRLFMWAISKLKIDPDPNSDRIYKKCLMNNILLRIMDLSGITYRDTYNMLNDIKNELVRRGSA